MSNQLNGILMMVLGVILAILYFALIIIIVYGFYTYQKRG